jgi:hypothetical protein
VCYIGRRGRCNLEMGQRNISNNLIKLKKIATSEIIAATTSVLNPDPDWILVQQGLRIRNPESDPGRQND